VRYTIAGLYVIIDPEACARRDPLWVARMALEGGASVVQWRDKRRVPAEQLDDARTLAEVCRDRGVPFIVNDDPDLAVAAGADGVHVGRDDQPVSAARHLVGEARIVGASSNNEEEAIRAEAGGADYVAIGSIFPTKTKSDARPGNLQLARRVATAVRIPVVAIGGINGSNIRDVVDTGVQSAAVISAVCAAEDPRTAAAELAAAFGA
jgi:thiamine-phosphate diphosphorylase